MVKAIVGANWGDEGKGKITDMLAEDADVVVRTEGGLTNWTVILECLMKIKNVYLNCSQKYSHLSNY